MTARDRKANDLRSLVEDILYQFRVLDANSANGPHIDLSEKELRVIEYLGDTGPRMMRELAEYLFLAVNSVTTTVDNLEARGLVRRQRSEEDRRVVRVGLTDEGRKVCAAAVGEKLSLLRRMLGALTEDEQEIFMVLFRKIARAGRERARRRAGPENDGEQAP